MAAIRKKQTAPTLQYTSFVAAFKALAGLYQATAFGNRNALQLIVASDTLGAAHSSFPIPHFITCRDTIPGRCPA
jgi:hypothetical protein